MTPDHLLLIIIHIMINPIIFLIPVILLPKLYKTGLFRLDGDIGTIAINDYGVAFRKPAIRVYEGDTGEFDNSGTLSYGGGNQVTVGVQFRLEDVFGGHASTRYVAHKHDGSVGWRFEVDVTGSPFVLRVILDDGVQPTLISAVNITSDDFLHWWIFTYAPNDPSGFVLYYGDEVKDIQATTSMASINTNSATCQLADATQTIAMMFGGFFINRLFLGAEEIATINSESDENWETEITDYMEIHTPGLQHDWGGAIGRDVDEGADQWRDVSGNAHHLNMTFVAANENGMLRQTIRQTHTSNGTLGQLTFSRHGTVLYIDMPEDADIDIGDAIVINTAYRKWTGNVEKADQGLGGTRVKAIGSDEESSEIPRNEKFSDRAQHQEDQVRDESNLIIDNSEGAGEAGSMYVFMNTKLALIADALKFGYGFKSALVSYWQGTDTVLELNTGDFSLVNREKTMKDSASEVTVVGYSNAEIPYTESFPSGGTVYDLTFRPINVHEVREGVPVITGFRVDADNKQLIFDATTTGQVSIKYTYRDINEATASDKDIEEAIGKKKKLRVWVGFVGDTPLATFAGQLLRGAYYITTIYPDTKKWFRVDWYVGKRIRINMTNDPLSINGYYFVSRVVYEGHILRSPKLELEEYDLDDGPPVHSGFRDVVDMFARVKDDTSHVNRGMFD